VPFLRKFFFVQLTVLPLQSFEVTLKTRLPDAFHHLVPNDNFHCQTPFKKQAQGRFAVRCAKTAEPIEMLVGWYAESGGPKKLCIRWGADAPTGRDAFRGVSDLLQSIAFRRIEQKGEL